MSLLIKSFILNTILSYKFSPLTDILLFDSVIAIVLSDSFSI